MPFDLSLPFLAFGLGSTIAVLAGAFALGLRHGLDWDHIAAITDITSSTASVTGQEVAQRPNEAGVLVAAAVALDGSTMTLRGQPASGRGSPAILAGRVERYVATHRQPLFLGTLYAVGHGTMVVVLGLAAILLREFLPGWIDPVMERVVGVTLVLLGVYLCYAIYRYLRGGEEFRLRSRWMLLFDGVRRGWRWLLGRAGVHEHDHLHHHHAVDHDRSYGWRTSYGIGLIHGVGAETGTQVLIIAAAVGAGSTAMSVATLFTFVFGLLISNSVVTVASTAGFQSARRRRVVYVAIGAVAAVFSLVVGFVFLAEAGGVLPSLDRFVRWIGGPD